MTPATATKTRGSERTREGDGLPPTLGPLVCAWMERYLVHSEGDWLGEPFRLRRFQKRFVYRAYELSPDGSRKHRRAVLGLPKGNGKTELAAAIACAELGGPVSFGGWTDEGHPRGVRRTAPEIPMAAASYEQANTVYGAAKTMIEKGPLDGLFECYDKEILRMNEPGRIYRVAAVAGTNDGLRPTFFVADELHEWEGNKERVHLVLSNGCAKRRNAWELSISTAGWDAQSLLGRLYRHGKRIEAGEEEDESFLFEWWEPSGDVDLEDEEAVREAVLESNPAAGDFLPLENVISRWKEIPEHEFRRYYLNQWTSAPDRWLPIGSWDEAASPDRDVPDGAEITIGFDGSYSGDSTAVVGCLLGEPNHLFKIKAWEKPDGRAGDEWRVDIGDVEAVVIQACNRWDVKAVGCDPYRWQRTLQALSDKGLPIVEWPSHSAKRMVPACAQFYDGIVDGGLTHDGDERMAQHVSNCVVKVDSRGPRISKDHKDSERRIDLAVAGVISYDMAVRLDPDPEPSKYEEEGITWI